MIKWALLIIGIVVLTWFVIRIIKVMLKTEKESKKIVNEDKVEAKPEYIPEEKAIDIHSATGGIPITDMSNNTREDEIDFVNSIMDDFDEPISSNFTDDLDDEFEDYSKFAHGSKGRRRKPVDFDLDGEMADEYIPSSPDFSYLPKRQAKKRQPLSTELNELPTELKVLMLSDIFDRKF